MPLRIVHVLSNFCTGGAEINACRIVSALNDQAFEQRVVSLTHRYNQQLADMLPVGIMG